MSRMHARTATTLLAATLALGSACGSPDPTPPAPPDPGDVTSGHILLQDGFEGFRWSRDAADMSATELEEWFGASGDFEMRPETDECSVATHDGLGLTAIMDSDTAVRALVAEGDFQTPEGIGVGSSLEEVRAAYGSDVLAEEQLDGTLYVVIDDLERPGQDDGTTSHYAFEVDQSGSVRVLRAGRVPWLLGCSFVDDGSLR